MRIAITADVHLSTKETHPERYNALGDILGQTETEGIDTLIIAGDLFDKAFRNYAQFEQLCRQHPKVQVHIIPGNHDPGICPGAIGGDSIHIYNAPAILELGTTVFLLLPYERGVTMGDGVAAMQEEIDGKQWVLVGHGDFHGGLREVNPLEPGTCMPLSRTCIDRFRPRATHRRRV